MGEKLNALGNIASYPIRLMGTLGNTANDLMRALTSMGYNYYERMGSRSKDIKEAIKNATNTGPQRKRRIKRPLAHIVGTGSYITGGIRAGLTSLRDGVGGILQACGNAFYNAGTATLRMGKKDPIGSFSFAKLQPENVEMGSYVMPRRFPAATATTPTP